jgi:tetratricopeptide (TPR) repeat protein
MLFDLSSGKRKRVVQVIYTMLALLMGGGLILFGIGGGGSGGLLDAIGIGGDSGGSGNPQYDQQISDYEAQLQQNPRDTAAMLGLAKVHYLSATSSGVSTDAQTGQISISEDAHSELEQAAAAWQKYLKTDPENPNANAATNAVQVYQLLNDAGGAAEAQQIVADAQKSSAAYGQLAFYFYADFKFKEADAAAAKAVVAADQSDRKNVEKSMQAYSDQAHKTQKLIKKQQQQQGGGSEATQQQLQDPFGSLGAGDTGVPTTPTP